MTTEATPARRRVRDRAQGDLATRDPERQHEPALGARRAGRSQRQGDQRQGRRVPARAARVHPARQDDRHRPPSRRAPADRRRAGHRQDDDGPPDGPQRRLRRPGQRPVHLLRARGAVPAQPAHRDGVRARPSAPQDRRDQDPGRPQGDPRLVGRRRPGGRPADEQPAPAAVARPDRPLRPEPVPRPRARRRRAPSTTSASSSSSTASCRAIGACSSSSTTCRRCRSSPSRRPSRRR